MFGVVFLTKDLLAALSQHTLLYGQGCALRESARYIERETTYALRAKVRR
jgi:hypothetical protein